MKKNLLLIAAILFMAANSFAATVTISVGGMSFTPATVTVHLGDVIKWVWADGSHTTTSTSVPAGGAASWNSPVNSTTTSFSYTPTVLGTYQYQCNFHVSMGMVGTITVVSATGVAPAGTTPLFSMFPNPASGSLHIQFTSAKAPVSVSITNIAGKEVMSKVYSSGVAAADLSLKNIPNGTYFIRAVQGDMAYKEELIVAH